MHRYAVTFLCCKTHECSSSYLLWTRTSVKVSLYHQHHSKGCKSIDNHGMIHGVYWYDQNCNIRQAFVSLFTSQAYEAWLIATWACPYPALPQLLLLATLIKKQNQHTANTHVPAELQPTDMQPYFSGTARYSSSSKICVTAKDLQMATNSCSSRSRLSVLGQISHDVSSSFYILK